MINFGHTKCETLSSLPAYNPKLICTKHYQAGTCHFLLFVESEIISSAGVVYNDVLYLVHDK